MESTVDSIFSIFATHHFVAYFLLGKIEYMQLLTFQTPTRI